MELTGMALAGTARMRERTVSSTPSLLTPKSVADVNGVSAHAAEVATPVAQGTTPCDDDLDKYDVSLIACTD